MRRYEYKTEQVHSQAGYGVEQAAQRSGAEGWLVSAVTPAESGWLNILFVREVDPAPIPGPLDDRTHLEVAGLRVAQMAARASVWSGWISGQGYMVRFGFETTEERREFVQRMDDLCLAVRPGGPAPLPGRLSMRVPGEAVDETQAR